MIKRLSSYIPSLVLFAAVILPCAAQNPVDVTVSTKPSGARFSVDGQEYSSAVTFTWPAGSKHTLRFVTTGLGNTQLDDLTGTVFQFGGWQDVTGLLPGGGPSVTITADPNDTAFTANVMVTYILKLVLGNGGSPSDSPTCGSAITGTTVPVRAGVVYVNGACYWATANIPLPVGQVTLAAIPFPGYVFAGWSSNIGDDASSLRSFTLGGPMTVAPRFEAAKRTKFITNPLGLHVLVDRAVIPTPSLLPCEVGRTLPLPADFVPKPGVNPLCVGEFDFRVGSQHLIGAPSPQVDPNGNFFVFDSWSIGGGQNTVYQADNQNVMDTLTANFLPGVHVTFVTSPVPLPLIVNGRNNWASYDFVTAVGAKTTVTAPATLVDSKGRVYQFLNWSNGGPATQDVIPDALSAKTGLRLTANYQLLDRSVVTTNIPGLSVKVNGAVCSAPCVLNQAAGTTVHLSAPAVIAVNNVTRYEFTGWVDGFTGTDRDIILSTDSSAYSANYIAANKLTVISDPPGGAQFSFSPPSPDGFYHADFIVSVVAAPQSGFKFRRWDGDSTESNRITTIDMSVPRTLRALLDVVPYVAPAGVRNAAGDTPVKAVAPGSVISIFGSGLTNGYVAGANSPLPQTLGGTVVVVNDRILGLVYVSPQQINAQLPDDLDPGTYTLSIKTNGQQDITTQFDVVRNAPGIFINYIGDKTFALALHQDGSPITPDKPATKDETITLLGTGFGPYTRPVVLGFAVPDSTTAAVQDPVQISAGGVNLQPISSGPAPGFVGLTATKFKLTSDVPSAVVDLKVSVNGVDSNTVQLPVQ